MLKTVFKVFLGLCLIFIGYNKSHAQERIYHEDALYGLKGNVSEVKTKTKTQLPLQNEFKFNKNGRLSLSTMTFNDAGYPMGFSISNGKSFADHKVIWNENKTPKSINTYSTLSPSKYTQTIEFFYGDDQFLPVKVVAVTEDVKKTKQTTVVCEYSDYELDDSGNWISRNVTETVTKKGKETTSSFRETRKITY